MANASRRRPRSLLSVDLRRSAARAGRSNNGLGRVCVPLSCIPSAAANNRKAHWFRSQPSSLVGHTDEAELLVVALDDLLHHLAEPGRVVLLLGLRLQRAALARDQQARVIAAVRNGRAPVEAQHARLVERLAGRVVLLPVGVSGLGMAGHDDPGLAALDA